MGAGMPVLRIASTIEPLEKNVRSSGYWLAISRRTRSMYSKLLILCDSFSSTWMVAV